MAVAINSYPLNNTLYTAEDAQLYTATRTNGIYSDDDFMVSAVGGQPLQISVSTGLGWIRYSKFGGFVVANKAATPFNLTTSHAMFKRIDRVVIRYDIIANQVELAVKTGDPTSNPVPAGLQRDAAVYELAIADITVEPGQTILTNANIADTRMDEELCGLMADGVTRIPTQSLYNAWYDWFSEIRAETDEQMAILAEWIEIFQNQTGEEFENWFQTFTEERERQFQTWLDAIGEQLGTEVGSALFGFAIEGEDLVLYYNNEADAQRFFIEDGCLMYELDDDIIGIESTSLARMKEAVQAMDIRVTEVENNDILKLIPEIGGE